MFREILSVGDSLWFVRWIFQQKLKGIMSRGASPHNGTRTAYRDLRWIRLYIYTTSFKPIIHVQVYPFLLRLVSLSRSIFDRYAVSHGHTRIGWASILFPVHFTAVRDLPKSRFVHLEIDGKGSATKTEWRYCIVVTESSSVYYYAFGNGWKDGQRMLNIPAHVNMVAWISPQKGRVKPKLPLYIVK